MSKLKNISFVVAMLVSVSVIPAHAGPTVGGFDDFFVGCDNAGACSITLDEVGNISGVFSGFFGPYNVSLNRIASTVNAAYTGLEVVSYEVVGKGSIAPIRLLGGALGICDFGVSLDGLTCTGAGGDKKGDVLVFRPGVIDGNGFGHTIIDFLSDGEANFTFATDFNVLEVGPQGSNTAFYRASGANEERLDFFITSDSRGSEIPEPTTLGLVGLALAGVGFSRRKRAT